MHTFPLVYLYYSPSVLPEYIVPYYPVYDRSRNFGSPSGPPMVECWVAQSIWGGPVYLSCVWNPLVAK